MAGNTRALVKHVPNLSPTQVREYATTKEGSEKIIAMSKEAERALARQSRDRQAAKAEGETVKGGLISFGVGGALGAAAIKKGPSYRIFGKVSAALAAAAAAEIARRMGPKNMQAHAERARDAALAVQGYQTGAQFMWEREKKENKGVPMALIFSKAGEGDGAITGVDTKKGTKEGDFIYEVRKGPSVRPEFTVAGDEVEGTEPYNPYAESAGFPGDEQ